MSSSGFIYKKKNHPPKMDVLAGPTQFIGGYMLAPNIVELTASEKRLQLCYANNGKLFDNKDWLKG